MPKEKVFELNLLDILTSVCKVGINQIITCHPEHAAQKGTIDKTGRKSKT